MEVSRETHEVEDEVKNEAQLKIYSQVSRRLRLALMK